MSRPDPVGPARRGARLLASLTLRQRVNGAILITFFLIALLFSAITLPLRRHSQESAVQKAQLLVQTLMARDREALANEIFEQQVRATRQRLIEMRRAAGIMSINVYNAAGLLLVSEGGAAPPANGGAAAWSTLRELQVDQVRWQATSALRFFQPIELAGERIGYIEIYYSLSDIEREQRLSLLVMAALLGSVLLAMMGLLNTILARAITNPITSLSQAIGQVQAGVLGSQVAVYNNDEIGDLSRAFNRMSLELRDAIARLADANVVLEHRIEERTAHLNASLAQLQATQHQMIHQEKMASLGQLVASVAHEINTPIAAVKSSGRSAAESLSHTLQDLPAVYAALSGEQVASFNALLACANQPQSVRTTREERQLVRELSQRLAAQGIDQAPHVAALLVQCQVSGDLAPLLPLLRHPARELILSTAQNVASVVSNTANINVAVERVAKIVFALKAFSRMDQSGTREAFSLQEGLETVLTIYQNQLKQGVELVRRYQDIAPVLGLPDEMNQVWTNLIHNALQAMHYRGTLTVSIRDDGQYAVVSVGDTGCGIPAAMRERIFEPIFTTKASGEGSGLGLDIVRKIVDKHGGRITVDSVEGEGTTFHVFLPRG